MATPALSDGVDVRPLVARVVFAIGAIEMTPGSSLSTRAAHCTTKLTSAVRPRASRTTATVGSALERPIQRRVGARGSDGATVDGPRHRSFAAAQRPERHGLEFSAQRRIDQEHGAVGRARYLQAGGRGLLRAWHARQPGRRAGLPADPARARRAQAGRIGPGAIAGRPDGDDAVRAVVVPGAGRAGHRGRVGGEPLAPLDGTALVRAHPRQAADRRLGEPGRADRRRRESLPA